MDDHGVGEIYDTRGMGGWGIGTFSQSPSITPPCAALVPHPLDPPLPLQLFRVHRKSGVEQAGALDCAPPNQQRRADQPVDFLRDVVGFVIVAVAPRPRIIRPALL